MDFRVYPKRGRAAGQEPWIVRLSQAPKEPMTMVFEDRRFTWHPGSDDSLPIITVPIESEDHEAERFAMERFLSTLSYRFGYSITVYSSTASGFKKELDPPLLRQPRMNATVFPAPEAVELADTSRDLSHCLALVREGSSSSSLALQYLSYWKAIEVAIGDPRFKSWIGPAAVSLWAKEGLTPRSWFKRLNETRVAAAHALPKGKGLRYHPDDPSLASRLRDEVGRMFQLAQRAIGERWPNPVSVRGRRY